MTGPEPDTEAIQRSETARRLRGTGPLGLLAMLVILADALLGPVFAAVLVLSWAHFSRTPLPALGLTPAPSWTLTLVGGAALGILLKLVLKIVVMPLPGPPPPTCPIATSSGTAPLCRASLPGC